VRVAVALVLPVLLAGCSEVEETLVLAGDGSGTYALSVRWNADLWRRAIEHVPSANRERLVGHPFPLDAAAWRDGLDGLEGVTVTTLEERTGEGGWQELAVELSFRSLPDLFRWEVLARRSAKLTVERRGEGEDAPRIARLEMAPLVFVPVFDPVAALLDAVARPPPPAEGLRAHRDPPPLGRFGLERDAAEDLWRLVGPRVAEATFTFDVTVRGRIEETGPRGRRTGDDTARCAFDFAALRDAATDRRVVATWRVPRVEDPPPAFNHAGETREAIVDALAR